MKENKGHIAHTAMRFEIRKDSFAVTALTRKRFSDARAVGLVK